jgi:hypothetical protein
VDARSHSAMALRTYSLASSVAVRADYQSSPLPKTQSKAATVIMSQSLFPPEKPAAHHLPPTEIRIDSKCHSVSNQDIKDAERFTVQRLTGLSRTERRVPNTVPLPRRSRRTKKN